jgi:proteasome lid subunit RPN8/RPN11
MSGVFDRLFSGERRSIRRVILDRDLLDELLGAASRAYPREFGALLEGSFENDSLEIGGFILPQVLLGTDNVLMKIGMLPSTTETVGSVHSHPSSSPIPSTADLHFFQKRGIIHFIMANPYVRCKVKGYDRWGRQIRFSVE